MLQLGLSLNTCCSVYRRPSFGYSSVSWLALPFVFGTWSAFLPSMFTPKALISLSQDLPLFAISSQNHQRGCYKCCYLSTQRQGRAESREELWPGVYGCSLVLPQGPTVRTLSGSGVTAFAFILSALVVLPSVHGLALVLPWEALLPRNKERPKLLVKLSRRRGRTVGRHQVCFGPV